MRKNGLGRSTRGEDLRSTRMKVSFSQKEMRRMRRLRKWIPKRWYSAQRNMADMM